MLKEFQFIIVPIGTLILCQLIKFTIESIQKKKINWARLFNGCGGMPSSHTSLCSSLALLIGYRLGFSSPIFGLSLVVLIIIGYDSMGLRMESGRQAVAINHINDSLFKENTREAIVHLKEELGHRPIEVVGGVLLGLFTSTIFVFFLS